MQNGCVHKIERTVTALSSNRVCPRMDLLVDLAMPTHLKIYTEVNIYSPPPPPPPLHIC